MRFNIKNEIKFLYEALMNYISFFGSIVFWVIAIIILIAIKQTPFALKFAAASVIVFSIEHITKLFYKAKRPDYNIVKPYSTIQKFQESSAFPSGHSANISLFTVMLHLEYGICLLTSLFVAVTILDGISRIYLKRHYAKDVIAGYAVGILIALLTSYIFI